MTLALSRRTEHITQAEIRVMTIECERARGVNLAQGVCDVRIPHEVVEGTVEAIDVVEAAQFAGDRAATGVASVPGSAFYLSDAGRNLVRFCFAKTDAELDDACQRLRRL